MSRALVRYRVLAYATGVLLLVLTLHVAIKVLRWRAGDLPYGQVHGLGDWIPGADTWVPLAHGYLYLAYVIVTADLWLRTRLPVGRTILVVLAGTVPGMSFVAEPWVRRRVTGLIAEAAPAPTA